MHVQVCMRSPCRTRRLTDLVVITRMTKAAVLRVGGMRPSAAATAARRATAQAQYGRTTRVPLHTGDGRSLETVERSLATLGSRASCAAGHSRPRHQRHPIRLRLRHSRQSLSAIVTGARRAKRGSTTHTPSCTECLERASICATIKRKGAGRTSTGSPMPWRATIAVAIGMREFSPGALRILPRGEFPHTNCDCNRGPPRHR